MTIGADAFVGTCRALLPRGILSLGWKVLLAGIDKARKIIRV